VDAIRRVKGNQRAVTVRLFRLFFLLFNVKLNLDPWLERISVIRPAMSFTQRRVGWRLTKGEGFSSSVRRWAMPKEFGRKLLSPAEFVLQAINANSPGRDEDWEWLRRAKGPSSTPPHRHGFRQKSGDFRHHDAKRSPGNVESGAKAKLKVFAFIPPRT